MSSGVSKLRCPVALDVNPISFGTPRGSSTTSGVTTGRRLEEVGDRDSVTDTTLGEKFLTQKQ